MSSSNRAVIINKLYKVLKKHYKPLPPLDHQPLLESLLKACCYENTKHELAEQVYQKVRSSFYDLNEIRVSTTKELAEVMAQLPDPARAAAQLKGVLQTVFESDYSFDMESLKKQNLGQAIKRLEKVENISPFVVSYAVQTALGGHSIPLDRGALQVMYIIGAINDKEHAAHSVPGLDRVIPKSKGQEFSSLLHQLSADLVANPFSPQMRETLLSIAPDCKERLPKRVVKKPEPPAPPPPPPAPVAPAPPVVAKPEKPVKGAPAPAAKKKPEPEPVKKKPAPPQPAAKAKKPAPAADKQVKREKPKATTKKKSSLKPLAKKKPR